jgi:acylphosphatase
MKRDCVRYAAVASGRVQGVGFRCFVQTNAKELSITGWARNMEDGTVHMELQGSGEQVDDLLAKIEKGSFFIKVEELSLKEIALCDDETTFVVRY